MSFTTDLHDALNIADQEEAITALRRLLRRDDLSEAQRNEVRFALGELKNRRF